MTPVIQIENVSKLYKLGYYGANTFRDEALNFFARLRGKPAVNSIVGATNNLSDKDSDTDLVWALKDINLTVNQGDIVGIIGKNGAGKSTLLKILSKITAPTTGSIKIRGRIASLLEVGTGMHDELTGRENIFLNGAILGMTKHEIRSKLDEIIDFAGIAKYIDTPIKRYSSGMRVRLGFAIAAHLDPEILIVDEVLAVGDAEFQKRAIGKMQDISKGEGRTVLFVSHNMTAVRNLCKRGVVLTNGTIDVDEDVNTALIHYLKYNETDKNRNTKIIDKISYCLPTFHIEKITINGNESCHTIIQADIDILEVTIEGYTDIPQKVDLILIFSNKEEAPLATLAEGPYKGNIDLLHKGIFSYTKRVRLPKYIFKGETIVQIMIHNPRVEWVCKVDKIIIEFEGHNTYKYGEMLEIERFGLMGLESDK